MPVTAPTLPLAEGERTEPPYPDALHVCGLSRGRLRSVPSQDKQGPAEVAAGHDKTEGVPVGRLGDVNPAERASVRHSFHPKPAAN